MNLLKQLFFSIVLLTSLCLISSCDKEGDDYSVTIDILAPTENAVITANEAFTVAVDIARVGEIIHNVSIMIVDSAGNHIQKLEDRHVHEADQYSFKKEDVVISAAGTYQLMVVSTDMEGEHEEGSHEQEEEDHEEEEDANIQMRTFEVI